MFNTVLIANRGEIALRVARTCRELDLNVVAVHSTVDRDSTVVRLADEAVQIGPAAARHSYLNIPAIIEAAKRTGAEAIHPGYGFLSEDPDFAEVCENEGFIFVGPPAEVLEKIGDKAITRALLAKAGLPVLPGSNEALESTAAAELADAIGFPVMIKPAAGGGGRGVRIVEELRDFPKAYREARATAQAVFGDGRVYIERYVQGARHIEIQLVCDRAGNAVHLGERDCSTQRRHQKLIEETPAPGLPEELIVRMGEAAVRGARAIGYVGTGTFEFVVDEAGDFFLIEINARIQVEHPVTEMVTGIDLVREQLRIAGGLPLSFGQHEVLPRGAAIECRINAEDPERDFAPTPGRIIEFVPPGGPFTRTDTDAHAGYGVRPEYDTLLAKVITWGPDREHALARMERALREFRIHGPRVETTRDFLLKVLAHPLFRDGKHTTTLVERMIGG